MTNRKGSIAGIILIILINVCEISAQISPGELSAVHSHLGGLSNCTQCHVLGDKPTNEKCLACHTEILSRVDLQKGYHSSADIRGKLCFTCHGEHNGKNFKLIRFDSADFDHNKAGYPLTGSHSRQGCLECHKSQFIKDPKLKGKKVTYLGVNHECLTCHTDYHMRTLSPSCLTCHNDESFLPATKFDHDKASFKLAGKHKSVECVECHKITLLGGNKFQQFADVPYSNCTSCHKDPHQNKYGQNCRQCHSEESFQIVSGLKNFDHNKTDYRLEGKHMIVNCKSCHKTRFTDPLRHDRCTDCHTDYHKNEFVKEGKAPDCSECHSVSGFKQFSFTLERHNMSRFKLEGAHSATPCYECHMKKEKWSFRSIGLNCKDCHPDIHKNLIQEKYFPGASCQSCHNANRWTEISFDHGRTGYPLTGAHDRPGCRECHFREGSGGKIQQKFAGLTWNCSECHKDNHNQQFARNGITDCTACHGTENWKASRFNHDNTAFKLDGEHIKVPCSECHKPGQEALSVYVNYKLKEFKCESCHF